MESEFCKLCFARADDLLTPTEEKDMESLTQLEPDLNGNIKNNLEVMCTDCLAMLRGYMEFKSSFMRTQACLQSFGTDENGCLLDLRQDVVVCRFCLKQTTGSYTTLVADQTELILVTIMMRKCFPGLQLGTITGHVICAPCHQALETSYYFITSLNVENRIKEDDEIEDVEFEDGPDLRIVDDCFIVKSEDLDGGVEAKAEKSFDQANQEDPQELEENEVEIRNRDVYDESEENNVIKEEDIEVEEHSLSWFEDYTCDVKEEQTVSEKDRNEPSAAQSGTTYSCESCMYEAKDKRALISHKSSHKKPNVVYKCEHCFYMTRLLTYICETCLFETKHKGNYKRQMLSHKDPSEVTIYKCESCTYETRHKDRLTTHKRTHMEQLKTPPDTKRGIYHYKRHMLLHKSSSEVTMYKCQSCTYETKRKDNLMSHQVIHKNSSDITMYKCEKCSFETRHKRNLLQHMRTHSSKSALETTIYKCKSCIFETRYKISLKNHQLTHENLLEVPRYKCATCTFETKHKQSLKHHLVIHRNPSEVPMHKCDLCSFETKHRRNYKAHARIHTRVVDAIQVRRSGGNTTTCWRPGGQ